MSFDAGLSLFKSIVYRWKPVAKAKMASRAAQIKRLDELLSHGERSLHVAFLSSVNKIKDSITLSHIEKILEAGDVDIAIRYIDRVVPGFFKKVAEARTDLFVKAGKSAATEISENLPLVLTRFDQSNTRAVETMAGNQARLVRELSESQRNATYQAMSAGIASGRNPREVARDFRDSIGLTERQESAVRNYRQALITGDTNVTLNRALRDHRFDSTVRGAALGNKKLKGDQITKMTDRYRERYLNHRSVVIARTEALRSVNEATYEMWHQVSESEEGVIRPDQIRRKWITAGDHRVRSSHLAIPSLNPQGRLLTESFITPLGLLRFPGDPSGHPGNVIQCRCVVVFEIVSPGEVDDYIEDFDAGEDFNTGYASLTATPRGPAKSRTQTPHRRPPAIGTTAHRIIESLDLSPENAAIIRLPDDTDKWEYFYHAVRTDSDLDGIIDGGVKPRYKGQKVFLSKDEIRDRGGGFAIVRVPKGEAVAGIDRVEIGLEYREWTVSKIPAVDVTRIVRQVTLKDGFDIREDELARAVLAGEASDADIKSLPQKYKDWLGDQDGLETPQPKAPVPGLPRESKTNNIGDVFYANNAELRIIHRELFNRDGTAKGVTVTREIPMDGEYYPAFFRSETVKRSRIEIDQILESNTPGDQYALTLMHEYGHFLDDHRVGKKHFLSETRGDKISDDEFVFVDKVEYEPLETARAKNSSNKERFKHYSTSYIDEIYDDRRSWKSLKDAGFDKTKFEMLDEMRDDWKRFFGDKFDKPPNGPDFYRKLAASYDNELAKEGLPRIFADLIDGMGDLPANFGESGGALLRESMANLKLAIQHKTFPNLERGLALLDDFITIEVPVNRQRMTNSADFFGSMTNNKVGWGHSVSYLKRGGTLKVFRGSPDLGGGLTGNATTEMFANYFMHVAGDLSGHNRAFLSLMKHFAPKTTSGFDDILRHHAKILAKSDDPDLHLLGAKPKLDDLVPDSDIKPPSQLTSSQAVKAIKEVKENNSILYLDGSRVRYFETGSEKRKGFHLEMEGGETEYIRRADLLRRLGEEPAEIKPIEIRPVEVEPELEYMKKLPSGIQIFAENEDFGGSFKTWKENIESKFLNKHNLTFDEVVARVFGINGADHKVSELVFERENDLTISIHSVGKTKSGVDINMTRIVDFERMVVEHESFKIDKGGTGKGIGKAVLKEAVGVYKQMEINKITLAANIDVGAYAWARYGFVPDTNSLKFLKSKLLKLGDSVDDKIFKKFISEGGLDDPKGIRALTELKGVDGEKIGKKFLLDNIKWDGYLDLQDAETMQYFDDYIAGKSTESTLSAPRSRPKSSIILTEDDKNRLLAGIDSLPDEVRRGKAGAAIEVNKEKTNRQAVIEVFGSEEKAEEFLRGKFDNADIYMAINGDNFEKVLGDGRFKNIIETDQGTFASGGTAVEQRIFMEEQFLGITGDNPRFFPKYGFINEGDLPVANSYSSNSLISYGDIFVKFRRETVGGRTTLTLGDSLDGNTHDKIAPPTPFENPDINVLAKFESEWEISHLENKSINKWTENLQGGYIEAQIYGDLAIRDIESIIVESVRRAKDLRKKLDDLGLVDVKVELAKTDKRLHSIVKGKEDEGTEILRQSLTVDDIDRLGDEYQREISALPYLSRGGFEQPEPPASHIVNPLIRKYKEPGVMTDLEHREANRAIAELIGKGEEGGMPKVFWERARKDLNNWTLDVADKNLLERYDFYEKPEQTLSAPRPRQKPEPKPKLDYMKKFSRDIDIIVRSKADFGGSFKVWKKKIENRFLNKHNLTFDEVIARVFGMNSGDYEVSELGFTSDGNFGVEIRSSGKTKSGDSINITRTVDFKKMEAEHVLFKIDKGGTGKGVGKTILKEAVDAYKQMGLKKITLEANIDVGAYAWARYGFVPDKDSLKSLKLELLGYADGPTGEIFKKFISEGGLDDPKGIRALTELKGADGERIGKKFLLDDVEWNGYLDLQDVETMQYFDDYIAGKSTESTLPLPIFEQKPELKLTSSQAVKAIKEVKENDSILYLDGSRVRYFETGSEKRKGFHLEMGDGETEYIRRADLLRRLGEEPAEIKPVEVKPAEVKPVEVKPVEVKPVAVDYIKELPSDIRVSAEIFGDVTLGNEGGDFKDWKEKVESKFLKKHNLTFDEVVARVFGMNSGDYEVSELEFINDGDFGIEIISRGITKDGAEIKITRNILFDEAKVWHELFEIDKGGTGKGIGKAILKEAVDLYKQIGIKTINLNANIDVGAYAWARYGFVPDKDSLKSLKSKLLKFEDSDGNKIFKKFISEGGLDDPKGIRALTELENVDGERIGKEFLLNHEWDGHLDLKDAETMQYFDDYIAGKSTEPTLSAPRSRRKSSIVLTEDDEKRLVAGIDSLPDEVRRGKAGESIEKLTKKSNRQAVVEVFGSEEKAEEFLRGKFDDADIYMVIEKDKLEKVLNQGRFKNLIETGQGTFADSVSSINNRIYMEEQFLGIIGDNPHSFPKYGFVHEGDLPVADSKSFSSLSAYGDTIIKFRRETIGGRTTLTLGDSLDGNSRGTIPPTPFENPDINVLAKFKSEQEIWQLENKSINKWTENLQGGYIEAQIYGDLTIKDIESIIVESIKQSKIVRKKLDDLGLVDVKVELAKTDKRLHSIVKGGGDVDTKTLRQSLTVGDIDRLGDKYQSEISVLPKLSTGHFTDFKSPARNIMEPHIKKYQKSGTMTDLEYREANRAIAELISKGEEGGMPKFLRDKFRKNKNNWTLDVADKNLLERYDFYEKPEPTLSAPRPRQKPEVKLTSSQAVKVIKEVKENDSILYLGKDRVKYFEAGSEKRKGFHLEAEGGETEYIRRADLLRRLGEEPAEIKPVEVKPVEAKPAKIRPAVTDTPDEFDYDVGVNEFRTYSTEKEKVLMVRNHSNLSGEYLKMLDGDRVFDDPRGIGKDGMLNFNSAGYHDFNEYLRKGVDLPKHKKVELGVDVRVVNLSPPTTKDLKVFRAIADSHDGSLVKAFEKYSVGDVVRDKGFVSTTIDRNYASQWGTRLEVNHRAHLEIEIPKGSRNLFIGNSSEGEITFGPNSKFEIIKIKRNVKRVWRDKFNNIDKTIIGKDDIYKLRYLGEEVSDTEIRRRAAVDAAEDYLKNNPGKELKLISGTKDERFYFGKDGRAYSYERIADREWSYEKLDGLVAKSDYELHAAISHSDLVRNNPPEALEKLIPGYKYLPERKPGDLPIEIEPKPTLSAPRSRQKPELKLTSSQAVKAIKEVKENDSILYLGGSRVRYFETGSGKRKGFHLEMGGGETEYIQRADLLRRLGEEPAEIKPIEIKPVEVKPAAIDTPDEYDYDAGVNEFRTRVPEKEKSEMVRNHSNLSGKYLGMLDKDRVFDDHLGIGKDGRLNFHSADYHDFNKYLRKGSDLEQRKKVEMGVDIRIINLAPPIDSDLKVFRAIPGSYGGSLVKAFEKYSIGDIFKDKGFVSTTIDRNYASQWGDLGRTVNLIHLEIDIPKGSRNLFIGNSREGEITFGPNSKFEIIKIKRNAKRVWRDEDGIIDKTVIGKDDIYKLRYLGEEVSDTEIRRRAAVDAAEDYLKNNPGKELKLISENSDERFYFGKDGHAYLYEKGSDGRWGYEKLDGLVAKTDYQLNAAITHSDLVRNNPPEVLEKLIPGYKYLPEQKPGDLPGESVEVKPVEVKPAAIDTPDEFDYDGSGEIPLSRGQTIESKMSAVNLHYKLSEKNHEVFDSVGVREFTLDDKVHMPIEGSFRNTTLGYHSNYNSFNSYLRKGEDLLPEGRVLLGTDKKVLENMPPISEDVKVYRGVNFWPDEREFDTFLNLKVGDGVSDKGFVSTTLDVKYASYWMNARTKSIKPEDIWQIKRYILEIDIPKGSQGLSVSNIGEQEIVFGPNSKFEVVKIRKDAKLAWDGKYSAKDNVTIIKLRYLGEKDKNPGVARKEAAVDAAEKYLMDNPGKKLDLNFGGKTRSIYWDESQNKGKWDWKDWKLDDRSENILGRLEGVVARRSDILRSAIAVSDEVLEQGEDVLEKLIPGYKYLPEQKPELDVPRTQEEIVADLKRMDNVAPRTTYGTLPSEMVGFIKQAYGNIDETLAKALLARFKQQIVVLQNGTEGKKTGAAFFHGRNYIDMGARKISPESDFGSQEMSSLAHEMGHYLDAIQVEDDWKGYKPKYRSSLAIREIEADTEQFFVKENMIAFDISDPTNRNEHYVWPKHIAYNSDKQYRDSREQFQKHVGVIDDVPTPEQLQKVDEFFNMEEFKFADHSDQNLNKEQLFQIGMSLQRKNVKSYLNALENGSDGFIKDRVDSARMIQDYYGALTNNKVGFGHSDSYYQVRGTLINYDGSPIKTNLGEGNATEAFANYINISRRDKFGFAIMKVLTPRTVEKFELLLKNIGVGEENFIANLPTAIKPKIVDLKPEPKPELDYIKELPPDIQILANNKDFGGDFEEWKGKVESKFLNKHNLTFDEVIARALGMNSGENKISELEFINDGDFGVEILSRGITKDGVKIKMMRSVYFDEAEVWHELFKIDKGGTGKGIGKTILKEAVGVYKQIGIKTINLNANVDVGAYAWARYGFVPDEDSLKSLKSKLLKFGDSVDNKIFKKFISEGGLDDPKGIRALTELENVDGEKIGKKFLIKQSWNGYLDLQDAKTMQYFDDYIAGKSTEPTLSAPRPRQKPELKLTSSQAVKAIKEVKENDLILYLGKDRVRYFETGSGKRKGFHLEAEGGETEYIRRADLLRRLGEEPAEIKPIEIRPVEVKPAEVKPVEVKPKPKIDPKPKQKLKLWADFDEKMESDFIDFVTSHAAKKYLDKGEAYIRKRFSLLQGKAHKFKDGRILRFVQHKKQQYRRYELLGANGKIEVYKLAGEKLESLLGRAVIEDGGEIKYTYLGHLQRKLKPGDQYYPTAVHGLGDDKIREGYTRDPYYVDVFGQTDRKVGHIQVVDDKFRHIFFNNDDAHDPKSYFENYKEISQGLLGRATLSADTKKLVNDLDEFFESRPKTTKEYKVFRSDFFDPDNASDAQSMIDSFRPGSIIKTKKFWSTSESGKYSIRWSARRHKGLHDEATTEGKEFGEGSNLVFYEIHMPKGIKTIKHNKGEFEHLLKRGQAMEVLEVAEDVIIPYPKRRQTDTKKFGYLKKRGTVIRLRLLTDEEVVGLESTAKEVVESEWGGLPSTEIEPEPTLSAPRPRQKPEVKLTSSQAVGAIKEVRENDSILYLDGSRVRYLEIGNEEGKGFHLEMGDGEMEYIQRADLLRRLRGDSTEIKPVEVKPVEVKPAEVKPVAIDTPDEFDYEGGGEIHLLTVSTSESNLLTTRLHHKLSKRNHEVFDKVSVDEIPLVNQKIPFKGNFRNTTIGYHKNYFPFNNYLRKGEALLPEHKVLLGADIRVLENIPPILEGVKVYRSVNYTPGEFEFDTFPRLKVGDGFSDKGFISTTLDKNYASYWLNFKGQGVKVGEERKSRKYMFEIDIPKGSRGLVVGNIREREITFGPNSKFEVVKIRKDAKLLWDKKDSKDNVTIIKLRYLGEKDKNPGVARKEAAVDAAEKYLMDNPGKKLDLTFGGEKKSVYMDVGQNRAMWSTRGLSTSILDRLERQVARRSDILRSAIAVSDEVLEQGEDVLEKLIPGYKYLPEQKPDDLPVGVKPEPRAPDLPEKSAEDIVLKVSEAQALLKLAKDHSKTLFLGNQKLYFQPYDYTDINGFSLIGNPKKKKDILSNDKILNGLLQGHVKDVPGDPLPTAAEIASQIRNKSGRQIVDDLDLVSAAELARIKQNRFMRQDIREENFELTEDFMDGGYRKIFNADSEKVVGNLKVALSIEKSDIFTAVSIDKLNIILSDGGQIKNAYASGVKPTFKDAFKEREAVESKIFGMDARVDASAKTADYFPKYGFILDKGENPIKSIPDDYGDVFIRFKSHVRERSTYTIGDSLNENIQGPATPAGRLDAPSKSELRFVFTNAISGKFDDKKYTPPDAGKFMKNPRIDNLLEIGGSSKEYVEIQMFGKISMDDVDVIYVKNEQQIENIKLALKKLGKDDIEVKHLDESAPI